MAKLYYDLYAYSCGKQWNKQLKIATNRKQKTSASTALIPSPSYRKITNIKKEKPDEDEFPVYAWCKASFATNKHLSLRILQTLICKETLL